MPPRPRKLALTYPEGPGTWRTAGRKLVAGGRVVAETMEGHME